MVFEWLKSTRPEIRKESYELYDFDRGNIEIKLLERNNPIINLGLALYGTSASTGKNLLNKGDNTIKKAVLAGTCISKWSNSYVKKENFITNLLDANDESLLDAFFNNEFIHDSILINLYERKDPFDKITDDEWYNLIGFTFRNKRLSTPYSETWIDGFDEFSY